MAVAASDLCCKHVSDMCRRCMHTTVAILQAMIGLPLNIMMLLISDRKAARGAQPDLHATQKRGDALLHPLSYNTRASCKQLSVAHNLPTIFLPYNNSLSKGHPAAPTVAETAEPTTTPWLQSLHSHSHKRTQSQENVFYCTLFTVCCQSFKQTNIHPCCHATTALVILTAWHALLTAADTARSPKKQQ